MTRAPRIYDFAPLLAGPIDAWEEHLPRVAAMGFDWLALDALYATDAAGVPVDTAELHPSLRPRGKKGWNQAFADFVKAAGRSGLSVMVDVDLVRRSADSPLVAEHPDWFRPPEAPLAAANPPPDPRPEGHAPPPRPFAWGRPEADEALLAHAGGLVAAYLAAGVRGFRCLDAWAVPAAAWRSVITAAREDGARLFVAEVLGRPTEDLLRLAGAGFDLVTDSARWWDFSGSWLLEQREAAHAVAPTLSFPDHRDGLRLAAEIGGPAERIEAHARLRALFTAGFGTGFLVPMGFEYGLDRSPPPGQARPGDWRHLADAKRFDLTGFLKEVNALKAAMPALDGGGPQRRVTAPGHPVVGLLRLSSGTPAASEEATLIVINTDGVRPRGVEPGPLIAASGGFDVWAEATPGVDPAAAAALVPGHPVLLRPLEVRVFRGRRRAFVSRARDAKASLAALERLAADRVAIEAVTPEVDGGRFPVKRVVGDVLEVEADVFVDGHEVMAAAVLYRQAGERPWREVPMAFVDNDRWRAPVPLERIGRLEYTIHAWRDLFAAWRRDILKKIDADQNVALETTEGLNLLEAAVREAKGGDKRLLKPEAERAADAADEAERLALLLRPELFDLMTRLGPRTDLSRLDRVLEVVVERPLAASAAWYELFPRSQSGDPERHGTFDDVIKRLPDIRAMGFDVLYFPPIHPIGKANRKGRNNTLTPGPDDTGSPYAIGSSEGGHTEIHRELGDFESFKRLVRAARDEGLEIALDFAIQCAPDHPWIKDHPEWFDWRPDGTIKYAENPPKKYQDIVNVHFYRKALPDLWYELRDVVLFWVDQGVTIFRVDNPHTKPYPFWEWMIREVQDRHPETMFLAEAFTRPKVMRRLAKVGFGQSYSYFTWRTTKAELTEYLTELTAGPSVEYMRPNFFVNTPDINPPYLQTGGRAAHLVRLVLAATLGGCYGVFEPFVVCDATPIPGREEYLDSEKYQIRAWDLDRPGNLKPEITALNRLRRDNPALREFTTLRFLTAWNDDVLAYAKITPSGDNAVVVAVNLDFFNAREATIDLPLWRLGLPDHAGFRLEDLMTGRTSHGQGRYQTVRLDPLASPFVVWRIGAHA